MTESFLHYVWELQYFRKDTLLTTRSEDIVILHPGYRNTHSGPDFFNARIKIGGMEWVGSVEIHIQASGWIEHKHNTDEAYESVVLHVVWNDNKPVRLNDGSWLPTLELKNRVPNHIILQYRRLIHSPEPIPCASKFIEVSEVIKRSMLDKVLVDRLTTKADDILALFHRNNNGWEETCFQLLSRNFGFKVNVDPFQQLSQSLPYKYILKHSDQLLQVEALLFGQAGFLEEKDEDDYYRCLQREYVVLARKYSLYDNRLKKVQWRFLRLRPANFPTLRIAQLASLVQLRKNLFSALIAMDSPRDFFDFFSTGQSAYWHHHYQFFTGWKREINTMGKKSIENIVINTVVPILVAYGKAKNDQVYIDRGVCILQAMPAESNYITSLWKNLELPVQSAFDSQATVQLYNNYCLRRRCLDCKVGASLVNPRWI